MRKNNLILKPALVLLMMGSLTVSCNKDEIDEVRPVTEEMESMESELTKNALASHLIFEETVEGVKPFSTVHNTELGASHSLTFVNKPGQSGKAARFELRQNDPDVKSSRRAEVTVVKDAVNKDMWYAFEAYFPSDGYIDEKDGEVINQWFQSGMGSPSTSLRTRDGRIQLRTGNDPKNREQIDLGPVTKNTWHNFVIHIVHSSGSDGLIELWINDKKLVDRKGGNTYSGGDLPKWKLGIYKSTWAKEKTTTDKRIMFYDNIRVGNSSASYSKFASTGGTTTSPTSPTAPTAPTTPTTGDTETKNQDAVVSFTLINSSTNKAIATIKEGDKISMSKLGVHRFNIRANTNPSPVGNVQMVLTGAESKVRVDDEVPYALFGDTNGDYHNWSRPTVGNYTLTATPHSGTKSKSGPPSGPSLKVNFSIVK